MAGVWPALCSSLAERSWLSPYCVTPCHSAGLVRRKFALSGLPLALSLALRRASRVRAGLPGVPAVDVVVMFVAVVVPGIASPPVTMVSPGTAAVAGLIMSAPPPIPDHPLYHGPRRPEATWELVSPATVSSGNKWGSTNLVLACRLANSVPRKVPPWARPCVVRLFRGVPRSGSMCLPALAAAPPASPYSPRSNRSRAS